MSAAPKTPKCVGTQGANYYCYRPRQTMARTLTNSDGHRRIGRSRGSKVNTSRSGEKEWGRGSAQDSGRSAAQEMFLVCTTILYLLEVLFLLRDDAVALELRRWPIVRGAEVGRSIKLQGSVSARQR